MPAPFNSVYVDIAKLVDYCLNETHPRGRHKARVFKSRLGLTAENAELLRSALFDAVAQHPSNLLPTNADEYGQRYLLDFTMTTPVGTAVVRSSWIVLTGQDVLRLTSCYVQ